jgi:hypothetical protein
VPEDLIGSAVQARSLVQGAAGRPGNRAADALRDSEYRADGHEPLGDEDVVAFQGLLVVVLGPRAHVDRPYPGRGHLFGHPHVVQQPGRVLAEARVVRGEPANEKAAGAQAELGGDGLAARVKDGEQPADVVAADRQEGIEEAD